MPAPHSGLGLSAYAQATSPMRRYLDLVVHQQLHAYLANRPLLTAEQILERVGAVEAILPRARPAEQYSERHWIMVYLLRRPNWRAAGCWSTSARTTARSSSPTRPGAVDPPVRRPAAGQRVDAQPALGRPPTPSTPTSRNAYENAHATVLELGYGMTRSTRHRAATG